MELVGQRQLDPMRLQHIPGRSFKHRRLILRHLDLARLIPPPRPLPPPYGAFTTAPATCAFTLIATFAGLFSIRLLGPLLQRRAERLAQITAIIVRPPIDGDDDVLIRLLITMVQIMMASTRTIEIELAQRSPCP